MTEEYWANSPFSIARHTGCIEMNGVRYIIVDKLGRDIYECSAIADKEGRDKAIEPGEPADLLDERYKKYYRKLGRDRFIELVKQGYELKDFKQLK